MPQRVFLFDFDGTIADSITSIVTIFNELADTYNLPKKIEKKDLPYLRKLPLHKVIQEFHIPSIKIPFLLYEGRKKLSQQIQSVQLVHDMEKVLFALKKQGMLLGIVTSNSTPNVQAFLKKNNIEIFDVIHSEKGLFGKDKVLQHVITKYNFSSQNTFYVGDEIRDIDAAKKAGIKIISVTWGANDKEALERAKPDYIIDKPSELLEFDSKLFT